MRDVHVYLLNLPQQCVLQYIYKQLHMNFLIYGLQVTQHEKTKLICNMHKLHNSHYFAYLSFYVRYTSTTHCTQFPIVFHMSSKSFTDKLCYDTKL